ncbi:hypothetical protein BH24ACI5_BH24ACI5_28620 [soil metagenome]
MTSSSPSIVCSGWQYKHWRGDFYPSDLPATRWFEHYAAQFDTVEIYNTLHHLPEEETLADWLHEHRRSGRSVYAYFNNDVGGHAPRDAIALRRLLEARA